MAVASAEIFLQNQSLHILMRPRPNCLPAATAVDAHSILVYAEGWMGAMQHPHCIKYI